MPFKIVAIRYKTCLTMFIQLPETIGESLLWNLSQYSYHTIYDGIHVRKTCTFDGLLQAGKQEEVRRSQIRVVRRVIEHSYHLLSLELAHKEGTV